jgi:hypothetical protein
MHKNDFLFATLSAASPFSRSAYARLSRVLPSLAFTATVSVLRPSHFANSRHLLKTMPKRKSSTTARAAQSVAAAMPLPTFENLTFPPAKRRASQRIVTQQKNQAYSLNPDLNPEVLDGPEALRASPDAEELDERLNVEKLGIADNVKDESDSDSSPITCRDSGSSLSDMSEETSEEEPPSYKKGRANKPRTPVKVQNRSAITPKLPKVAHTPMKKEEEQKPQFLDPEADGDEEADEGEIQEALSRPPPVNSDYLPLPWNGRLGYVCCYTFIINPILTYFNRLVFVHTYASPILLCSAPEHVVLHQSWKIGIH